MTCLCGAPSEAWTIPNPYSAEPMEIVRCTRPTCRREYVQTHQGAQWVRTGVWCADPECDQPTFHLIAHPKTGHPVRLWPRAEARVAQYRVGEGSMTMQYYCSDACAPDLGAPPHHEIECADGETAGACIGLLRAKDRHPECFTDERGQFLRVWLNEFRMDRDDYLRLIDLWERDKAA